MDYFVGSIQFTFAMKNSTFDKLVQSLLICGKFTYRTALENWVTCKLCTFSTSANVHWVMGRVQKRVDGHEMRNESISLWQMCAWKLSLWITVKNAKKSYNRYQSYHDLFSPRIFWELTVGGVCAHLINQQKSLTKFTNLHNLHEPMEFTNQNLYCSVYLLSLSVRSSPLAIYDYILYLGRWFEVTIKTRAYWNKVRGCKT